MGSQWVDHFVNLERRKDRKANRTPSVRVENDYTDHTSRSHSRPGIHISYDEETKNLRLEIDHLCKKLCCREHVASLSSLGIDLAKDCNYRHRSRTLPSKSFSASSCLDKEERHYRRRAKSSPPRSMGNDAMSKALHQISKSPFTR